MESSLDDSLCFMCDTCGIHAELSVLTQLVAQVNRVALGQDKQLLHRGMMSVPQHPDHDEQIALKVALHPVLSEWDGR